MLIDSIELQGFAGIRALAFSADGLKVGIGGCAGKVAIYDCKTRAVVFSQVHHTHFVNCIAFSPDGGMLATGSHDRTVRLHDTQSGSQIRDFGVRPHVIESLAFSADGTTLAAAVFSRDIELWDLAGTGADTDEPRYLEGHALYPSDLAFAADGTLFSSGAEGVVRLWDAELSVETLALSAGAAAYESVALSPDGRTVAAGRRDGTIDFWHAASEEEVLKSGWDQKHGN